MIRKNEGKKRIFLEIKNMVTKLKKKGYEYLNIMVTFLEI